MQHGDVVAHRRRLADDDAGAVVEEHPAAQLRRRVDVHLEQLRAAALQVEGERLAPVAPQEMGDAVGLDGEVALEEQERLQIALAGRVALEHRAEVGLGRGDDVRVGRIGVVADLAQAHGPELLVPQLARELVGQGGGELAVAEHHRVQKRGEPRLGRGGARGFGAQRGPYGRRRFR